MDSMSSPPTNPWRTPTLPLMLTCWSHKPGFLFCLNQGAFHNIQTIHTAFEQPMKCTTKSFCFGSLVCVVLLPFNHSEIALKPENKSDWAYQRCVSCFCHWCTFASADQWHQELWKWRSQQTTVTPASICQYPANLIELFDPRFPCILYWRIQEKDPILYPNLMNNGFDSHME